MAVVRNHFEKELTDINNIIYNVAGLTAENSACSISGVNVESSIYFLKAIYKTLLDAGYTDVIVNESDFSITMWGFKFFVLQYNYCDSISTTQPNRYSGNVKYAVFAYGRNDQISYPASYTTMSDSIKYDSILNYPNLSFDVIVRGDKNCVYISYSSARCPLLEYSIIFIAKVKNLITSENAFFYCGSLISGSNNSSYYCAYIRNKNDLFNSYMLNSINNNNNMLTTENYAAGLSTSSKFICEPITCYYCSFLIYSVLRCNHINFSQMKYYKIGTDLYYCYGFQEGNSQSIKGAPFLFKVS